MFDMTRIGWHRAMFLGSPHAGNQLPARREPGRWDRRVLDSNRRRGPLSSNTSPHGLRIVNHPSECNVGKLVFGVTATDIAMHAWKPHLLELLRRWPGECHQGWSTG